MAISDLYGAAGSTVAGGAGGAAAYATIGGIGIAIGGTAFGITLGPFIAIGAGTALTAYGLIWLGWQLGAVRPGDSPAGGASDSPTPGKP